MNTFVRGGIMLVVMSSFLASCSFHRLVAGRKAKSYDSSANGHVADTGSVASFRHAVLPQPDTTIVAAIVPPDTTAETKKLIAVLTPVWNHRLDYKTFSGKAKMHFEGPDDKQEFTANFRVRKDSVIWINVTAFGGLPAARIFITRDSFFMTIPLKKEYKAIPLSEAAKILPTRVDFSSLQNLVLGEPLRDGVITDAASFGGSWSVQVEDSNYIQRIAYNKADTAMRTGQMRTRKPGGPQAISEYGSYEIIDGHRISTQRVLNIQNGDDVYMLDMNFSKCEFDVPQEYPFSIPKSYSEKK